VIVAVVEFPPVTAVGDKTVDVTEGNKIVKVPVAYPPSIACAFKYAVPIVFQISAETVNVTDVCPDGMTTEAGNATLLNSFEIATA